MIVSFIFTNPDVSQHDNIQLCFDSRVPTWTDLSNFATSLSYVFTWLWVLLKWAYLIVGVLVVALALCNIPLFYGPALIFIYLAFFAYLFYVAFNLFLSVSLFMSNVNIYHLYLGYEYITQSLHYDPLIVPLVDTDLEINVNLPAWLFMCLPDFSVLHAQESNLDILRENTTRGGQLVSTLLTSAINSNTTGLDIFLTDTGFKESLKLIELYNAVPANSPLLDHISLMSKSNYVFHTTGNVDLQPWVLRTHTLPVSSLDILYCANDSGVYMFTHPESNHISIGSSLSMKSRNMEHYVSIVRKPKLFMHYWVKENGGLLWSPIVTGPNYLQSFTDAYPLHSLTRGENNLLMACSVYVPRVYEQVLQSHFVPYLNGSENLKPVVFFNYSMNPTELNVHFTEYPMYEIYDAEGTYLKTTSINKLEVMTGRGRNALTRYMNYIPQDPSLHFTEGMLTFPDLDNRTGYLRRVGDPLLHTLPPAKTVVKQPLTLPNVDTSLFAPNLIYVFEEDKETLFNTFTSRRDLFLEMYSSKAHLLDKANYTQSREILRNYVTAHLNNEALNRTDLGYYYFASHAEYGKEYSQDLFVVDTVTGKGEYFESITSCSKASYTAPNKGVRNYINGVTTPSQAYQNQAYIPSAMLIDALPGTIKQVGIEYDFSDKLSTIMDLKSTLRQDYISSVPNYKGRAKSVTIVVVNSITSLATLFTSLHLASESTGCTRQNINKYLTGQYKPVKFPHLSFVTHNDFISLLPTVSLQPNTPSHLTTGQIKVVQDYVENTRKNYHSL